MRICALLLAAPLAAEPVACSDPGFSVEASDGAIAGKICQTATIVRDRLADCGLVQSGALTIEVVNGLSHPLGDCLAYYDCDHNLIRITEPSLYGTLLDPEIMYALLPPDLAMRSLLTHELSHALIDQMSGDREVPLVDHEYIAAAMELDLLEPEWRERVIAAAPVDLPPKIGLIDIWIYYFAPRKFAVNAWQHFSLPGNGCGLVSKIVQGERTFDHPPL